MRASGRPFTYTPYDIIDEQGRLAARVLGEISELTLVAMVDEVAAE